MKAPRRQVLPAQRGFRVSSSNASFAERFTRLRFGGQEGEIRALNEYATRLLGLARSRLHSKTQVRVDPEDVVQSAMLSFAIRHTGEVNLQVDDGLWDKLLEITLRHCNKWNRRVQRERAQLMPLRTSQEETDAGFEPADEEPGPEEVTALADLVEWLMRGLEMPYERQVVMLRLQGYSVVEIASTTSLSERTVARTISEVKGLLAKRLEQFREER